MRNFIIYTTVSLLLGMGALTFGMKHQFQAVQSGGGSHEVGARPSRAFTLPAQVPNSDQLRALSEVAASYEVKIDRVDQMPTATQLTIAWKGCGDYLGRDFIDSAVNRDLISTFQALDLKASKDPDRPTAYEAVYWVRFKRP